MDKFTHYLVSQIVDNPEAVRVEVVPGDNDYQIIQVTVDPKDMGKIIGKSGRTIAAIRDLVKVMAIKNNQRVRVVLIEPEAPIETDPVSPPGSDPAPPADKS